MPIKANGIAHNRFVVDCQPNRATPLPRTARQFAPDASIVLVGIRGSGKSTLGVIACVAMERTMIDLEKAFQQSAGSTSGEFRRLYGPPKCLERQVQVLRAVMLSHSKGCVIICSWLERNIQALLRDFSLTNPVVLVTRDAEAIQEHLKISDTSKVSSILNASTAILRTCTNFQFFNVTERHTRSSTPESSPAADSDNSISRRSSPAPHLTLKRAERHFLKFLSLIMPPGSIPFIETAFPLATVATEVRDFTYAVSVPISTLLNSQVDIEEIETGADAIEIVVDNLWTPPTPGFPETSPPSAPTSSTPGLDLEYAGDIAKTIGSIRRNTVLPIIFHVLAPASAQVPDNWQRLYIDAVSHGLRLATEFVTIDLRLDDHLISDIISVKRQSKVIATSESTSTENPWDSPIWMSQYRRAQRLGCDLVRFVRPASRMQDNLAVAHFRSAAKEHENAPIPLIAYNSGLLGRHSACFNPVLTPMARMALASRETTSAAPNPCLTTKEATQALYSSFVYDSMKLYVFGAKVDYSLSPAMHNAALETCGIPHRYSPFSANSLDELAPFIQDPFFAGASIGLPFKVSIIQITNALSPHAKAIGAVNTLIPIRRLNPDGTVPTVDILMREANQAGPVKALFGENTDWIGIRACVRRGLSPANAVRPTSTGVVIGAGGMARAAVYALLQLGVRNIVIYNRTIETARDLVTHFNTLLDTPGLPRLGPGRNTGTHARFHVLESLDAPWPDTFSAPTMIISCIPTHSIGSAPSPDFTVPHSWLASPTGGVVVELGYKTLDTPLLEQSRREAHRGWVTLDGLDLLPEQGFAQFELFTGRRAPRRLMRRAALRAFPAAEGMLTMDELKGRLRSIPEQEP
ncbi:related to Quinate repressor protein [Cephalotrichum gorgonifer]|uniref:Related to Quinate repressor protein n=1 Tax=Cephalotrichum gorgonifer TaxID=2041049 RepID=A0AAE8MS81_9PEZI|nr:related to Quinate repressor protein [Cephalotrichum gorgonifer]